MSSKVKVYVVEDKSITRETIILSLKKSGFEVVGSHDEAIGALDEINKLDVDIAILDINLRGEEDGIWLANEINKNIKIPFVYLTAFGDEDTLKKVVDSKPYGYLMKPFNSSNIYTSIHIALQNYSEQKNGRSDLQGKDENVNNKSIRIKDSIFIKDKDSMIRLKLHEICYIKSENKYLEIYLTNKKHVIRCKLLDFQMHLPNDKFIQVHQRYLINVDMVNGYRSGYVQINNIDIPVSRSFSDAVSKRVITL